MMRFASASIQQILFSHFKDEFYLKFFNRTTRPIFEDILDARQLIKYQRLISESIRFIYYFYTTVRGDQTLGEEFARIVQISSTRKSIPSFFQRFLLALCYSFESRLLCLIHFCIKNALANIIKRSNYDYEIETKGYIDLIWDSLNGLNQTLFFFHGTYYDLWKRLIGIRYLSTIATNEESDLHHNTKSVKLIAYLTLISTCLTFISKFVSLNESIRKNHRIIIDRSRLRSRQEGHQSLNQCTLCLDGVMKPTLLLCGHVFCWDCIVDWLDHQEECPLCHATVEPTRVVFLNNY
ncbi:Peroxisome biogenesis factor 10 [Sarcoptes scabiei]|uniref:RING-type E3 ubiquitin transferase n=1 Tax=Sarcoptes scabiei TaxID=52283 RepID=A0A834R284_SARSC|nr:Peroxisome biogenesis factor 10 [Sarcoptes scabiei]